MTPNCTSKPCAVPSYTWRADEASDRKDSIEKAISFDAPYETVEILVNGIPAGYLMHFYMFTDGAPTGKNGTVYYLGEHLTPGWNIYGVVFFSLGMTLLCCCCLAIIGVCIARRRGRTKVGTGDEVTH